MSGDQISTPRTIPEGFTETVGGLAVPNYLGEIAYARERSEGPGIQMDMIEGILVNNSEHSTKVEVSYIGRIEFGQGSIDASGVESEQFMSHLVYIAKDGLYYIADYSQSNGGCMDGRENLETLTGKPVDPRPKILAGPSGFSWYVASIGGFKIIEGIEDPKDQFVVVNKALQVAGLKLGMHVSCGGAQGVEPVTANYGQHFDDIMNLSSPKVTERLGIGSQNDLSLRLMHGIGRTSDRLQRHGAGFTEEYMHGVVISLENPDSVIRLKIDENHKNHSHDEGGLVLLDVANAVAYKDRFVNQFGGAKLFYQNVPYGNRIVDALTPDRNPEERAMGYAMVEQLAFAGVGTLGKQQHIGRITGSLPKTA